VSKPYDCLLHCTHDQRPWTQPRARNLGASLARAPKLLFFDIDHMLTTDIITTCLSYSGDKLHWTRRPAILDAQGFICTAPRVLVEHGLTGITSGVHGNSFLIRAELFWLLGGYDERFCGRYGGDDIDFNQRYARLCQKGLARLAEVRGAGFVYPDPARDLQGLFHRLPRG
jgi:predicted glycosyltransferase involved in capsule biosynthesis